MGEMIPPIAQEVKPVRLRDTVIGNAQALGLNLGLKQTKLDYKG
jgi:hypothetical protein